MCLFALNCVAMFVLMVYSLCITTCVSWELYFSELSTFSLGILTFNIF